MGLRGWEVLCGVVVSIKSPLASLTTPNRQRKSKTRDSVVAYVADLKGMGRGKRGTKDASLKGKGQISSHWRFYYS